MNQSIRILRKLQQNKEIPETELFHNGYTSLAIRVALHRVRKIAGITVEEGIWKLDKEYWDITPVELRDLVIIYELQQTRKVVLYSFALAVILALVLGIVLGLVTEISYA